MERSDAASACSAPFVVFKGLQVFINVLNLSLTAATGVTAGGFSKQHRESDIVFKELKISVNKSKSECRNNLK